MGKKINLNLDWRFHLGDMPLGAPVNSPDFMGMNDSAWRVVIIQFVSSPYFIKWQPSREICLPQSAQGPSETVDQSNKMVNWKLVLFLNL